MKQLEFHPEAATELEASARHYGLQQAGLGERFLAAVEFALAGIVGSPEVCFARHPAPAVVGAQLAGDLPRAQASLAPGGTDVTD